MPKNSRFLSLFAAEKPILGMLHLKGDTPEETVERAMGELDTLLENGVDGVIVEDYYGTADEVEQVLARIAAERSEMLRQARGEVSTTWTGPLPSPGRTGPSSSSGTRWPDTLPPRTNPLSPSTWPPCGRTAAPACWVGCALSTSPISPAGRWRRTWSWP